jgi:hypothetical protein
MTPSGESDSGSEFGAGMVVCLAKFSEHLSDRWGQCVQSMISWERLPAERQAAHLELVRAADGT